MAETVHKGVRRSRKEDRRRKRKTAAQRAAVGVMAAATVAAVGAGTAVTPATAQAGIVDDINAINPATNLGKIIGDIVNNPASQAVLDQWRIQGCATGGTSGGADCSGSTGTGIAIVLPGTVDVVPQILYIPAQGLAGAFSWLTGLSIPDPAQPFGSAKVIGSGFQFAMASTGGKATAISYLPVSLATAGASDGRTAVSFALIGMANAWTTDDIPVTILGADTGLEIPGIKSVSCYGGLTGAYAEGVGGCVNIAGTIDGRLDLQQNIPELQLGLTDPTAILFDPAGVFGQVITQLLDGKMPVLGKDFVRLGLGGDRTDANGLPVLMTLTSDYGFQDPITVSWLGSTITFLPEVAVNGKDKPNYLGLPVITVGALDTGEIIPVVSIPQFTFPFGIPPIGPDATPTPLSVPDGPSLLRAGAPSPESSEVEAATPAILADGASEVTDTGYVGKHRAYEGKHRADDGSDDQGLTDAAPVDSPSTQEPAAEPSVADTPTTDAAASEDSASDSTGTGDGSGDADSSADSSDSGSSDSGSADAGSADSGSADSGSSGSESSSNGSGDSGSDSGNSSSDS